MEVRASYFTAVSASGHKWADMSHQFLKKTAFVLSYQFSKSWFKHHMTKRVKTVRNEAEKN